MNKYMEICMREAQKNLKKEELPIAAVIVKDNKIISKARNSKNIRKNALNHAEILCINKASKKLKRWNLNDCEMYVTLQPCKMCECLINESRIKKVYYLLPKLPNKKIYNKTEYIELDTEQEFQENYKRFLQKFFANKR